MPRPNRGPYLKFLNKRGLYYIRWSEAGRTRERSTGTSDLGEAEATLSEFLARRRSTAGPRDPGRLQVLEVLEDYATEHAPKTAAPDRIGYALDALTPFWASNTVADVSEATCAAYGQHRGVSDGTVRRELSTLSAAIRYAHKKGRLTRPVHVWLPPKPAGKDRWLERSEAAALMNAARHSKARLYLPLFVMLALRTGARKGAILDLRWPQVDLARGRIDFNAPGRRQTNKRRPVVPVGPRLLWFLRKARQRGTDLGYVVHDGDNTQLGNIKTSFRGAVARAGLADVTPHTLRHTAGTWMALAGIDLFKVARYLGHTHERTTELYAHHSPDYLRDAMEALE